MGACTRTCRRGFSIIEATLAVLLVGGAMVAALNVAATANRASGAATQRRHAERLAHTLLAEALSMPAAGTNGTTPTAGARLNNFDHLLDYQGFRESPPTTINGTACAPATWAWGVTVTSRGSEDVGGRTLNLRMYQVTATVELPDGTTVSVRALRGDSTSLQRAPVADLQLTPQAAISIRLPDGGVLHAAPEVLSQRPPDRASRTTGVR